MIKINDKKIIFKLVLCIFLPILILLGLSLGAFYISPIKCIKLFFSEAQRLNNSLDWTILLNIHTVRTFCAFFVGMLLALSGTGFQGLFRNPLADPYCMGISSGASFGAVLIITMSGKIGTDLFFNSPFVTNIGAFLGSMITNFLVFFIARNVRYNAITLLLAGTALSSLFSAMVSLLLITSKNNLTVALLWTMGSLSTTNHSNFFILFIGFIIIFPFLYKQSSSLDLLSGGEKDAQSLGANIKTIYLKTGFFSALATSLAVSAGGIIGFVGLVAPHITRHFLGPKHSKLFLWSCLLGGELTLLSDIICRIAILPAELPIGIITALFGAPFFISLIFTNYGRKNL